tara:strand:+ start:857 stop:1237 length:381 start_codon:yes stop_codon:yes gene_type:complete
MHPHEQLAAEDARFQRLYLAAVEQERLLYSPRTLEGRQYPFTEEGDVLAVTLKAISKVCKVRVPDWINQDADPNMVFSFVYKVLMHHGEQRQEDGVRIALANRPELDRDTMLRVARAHEALGEVLR